MPNIDRPATDETVKALRALHDGISDMIEGGRLQAHDIPDDYDWLIDALTKSGAHDSTMPLNDEYINSVNKAAEESGAETGGFYFGGEGDMAPMSDLVPVFEQGGTVFDHVKPSDVKPHILALLWSTWHRGVQAGIAEGREQHKLAFRHLLGL